ncbi:MAG: SDR family NAD(P)-dependent oxidoreductase [bacterium]
MIILTGVSGGIGKEILSKLLAMDQVIGIYNKTKPKVIAMNGFSIEKLDITDSTAINAFVEKRRSELKKVTLINLAASSIDALAANYSELDWDKVLATNLKGDFLLTKALLPIMINERWGRIVHVSSVVGMEGRIGTIAYSTTKTGLIGMSRVLAKEYARFNITSNLLVLGYFDVGLIETLSENDQKSILDKIPSKSFGKVSNIVNAIDFLIRSPYVNGAKIAIDGGL